MTDLSPETRALLSRAREGDGSTLSASHRARLKRGVVASAAAGALVTAAPKAAAAPAGASLGVVSKGVAVALVAGVVGVGGVAWQRSATVDSSAKSTPASPPAASVVVAASSRVAESPSSPPIAPPAEPPPRPPTAARAENPPTPERAERPRPVPTPPPSQSVESLHAVASAAPPETAASTLSLREEARLLREADRATKDGAPDRALGLLDEHASRFPNGVLEPERAAQRVFALCAAGRVDAATQEGARFLAVERPLRLAARVRSSCAGSPSGRAREDAR